MRINNHTEHIHIFSISDKDIIRIQEQHHEYMLRKRLLALGYLFDFDIIAHHGLGRINTV